MIRKIGRFEAYVPDKDLFGVLLKMLSLAEFKMNDEFNSPPKKLHRFFYDLKKKYPGVFEDLFFNHDPDFPYSEQIEDCFIRLQESAFITRPNPSFDRYRVDCDLTQNGEERLSSDELRDLSTIAEKFKHEFRVNDESSCR